MNNVGKAVIFIMTAKDIKCICSQNELSSPFCSQFLSHIFWGLDFLFYVIFLLIGIGQLENDV